MFTNSKTIRADDLRTAVQMRGTVLVWFSSVWTVTKLPLPSGTCASTLTSSVKLAVEKRREGLMKRTSLAPASGWSRSLVKSRRKSVACGE